MKFPTHVLYALNLYGIEDGLFLKDTLDVIVVLNACTTTTRLFSLFILMHKLLYSVRRRYTSEPGIRYESVRFGARRIPGLRWCAISLRLLN